MLRVREDKAGDAHWQDVVSYGSRTSAFQILRLAAPEALRNLNDPRLDFPREA
jgi:hypothetical protein